ncbi:MAG: hypothetical protein IKA63_03835 [Clostridia bacterium]|nr:hypothetical protein [Clostridia bacterium]
MNEDTIKLLKECNAGCKSATNSMEQVMPFIKEDHGLRDILKKFNDEHISIGDECHALLNEIREDEKDPHPAAKVFSWISTEMKLMMDSQPEHIAELLLDGCNMGIKSLSRYLNQYQKASEETRELTRKLIQCEQQFYKELLPYV